MPTSKHPMTPNTSVEGSTSCQATPSLASVNPEDSISHAIAQRGRSAQDVMNQMIADQRDANMYWLEERLFIGTNFVNPFLDTGEMYTWIRRHWAIAMANKHNVAMGNAEEAEVRSIVRT